MPISGEASPVSSSDPGSFTEGTDSERSSDLEIEATQEQPSIRQEFEKSLNALERSLDERDERQELLNKSVDERDVLEHQLEAKEQQILELQEQITRLERMIDDTNKKIAGRDNQIQARDTIIDKQIKEQDNVEQQNIIMQADIRKLQNENKQLMQEVVTLRSLLRKRNEDSPPIEPQGDDFAREIETKSGVDKNIEQLRAKRHANRSRSPPLSSTTDRSQLSGDASPSSTGDDLLDHSNDSFTNSSLASATQNAEASRATAEAAETAKAEAGTAKAESDAAKAAAEAAKAAAEAVKSVGEAAIAAAGTVKAEADAAKAEADAAKAAAVKEKAEADAAKAAAVKEKAEADAAKAAAVKEKADLEKERLALHNEKTAAGARQDVPTKCNCKTQEDDLRRRLRQAEAYNNKLMHLDTERDNELRNKSSQLADLHNLVKHYKRSNNGVIGKQEDTIANLQTAFCRILLCLPVDWFHGLSTIACTPICIGTSFANCCWISTTHDRTYHSVTVDGKTYKGSKCALDVIRNIAPSMEDSVNLLPNLPITRRGVADGETMSIKAMRLLEFGRKPTLQQDLERLVQQNKSSSDLIQTIIHKESERSFGGIPVSRGKYDMQWAMWMSNDFRNDFLTKYPIQCVFCCVYECLDILAAQESFIKSDKVEKRIMMQDKMQNMLSRSIQWNPDEKIIDQLVQSTTGMHDVTIG